MAAQSLEYMPTVGEIARRNGVTVHQVEYLIKSRRIQPAARAGNARVFGPAEVEYIAAELRRIAAGKEARS